MTTQAHTPAGTDLELVDGVLADLGTLTRRAANETLSEEDYRILSRRMRGRLLALRGSLQEAEPLELTDAGKAMAAAGRVGRDANVQALLRRIPALMTAQQLVNHPSVGRARLYGPFAAIDGGRT